MTISKNLSASSIIKYYKCERSNFSSTLFIIFKNFNGVDTSISICLTYSQICFLFFPVIFNLEIFKE